MNEKMTDSSFEKAKEKEIDRFGEEEVFDKDYISKEEKALVTVIFKSKLYNFTQKASSSKNQYATANNQAYDKKTWKITTNAPMTQTTSITKAAKPPDKHSNKLEESTMAKSEPYDPNCCMCVGTCNHTGPHQYCERHMPRQYQPYKQDAHLTMDSLKQVKEDLKENYESMIEQSKAFDNYINEIWKVLNNKKEQRLIWPRYLQIAIEALEYIANSTPGPEQKYEIENKLMAKKTLEKIRGEK